VVGRGDLYYGVAGYENSRSGVQLMPAAQRGAVPIAHLAQLPAMPAVDTELLLAIPITRLYDRGTTVLPSKLLHQRIPQPYIVVNPADAARLKLSGDTGELS